MKFSVVIPCWNAGRFIGDAVDSVLSQEGHDVEVIVVDDGSDDDTRSRLRTYREEIRLIHQSRSGAAAARNRGIGTASGEVVGFLDADDGWEPGTLDAVSAVLEERPAVGVVTIGAREVRADRSPTPLRYGKRSPGDDYTTAGLLRYDAGGILGFFVRRELFDSVGYFDETLRSAEECDLCLRMSFHTTMSSIRRPLLWRRKHDANLSGDFVLNARCWIALLEKLALEHAGFVEEHPAVYRRSLAKEHLRLGRELLAAGGDPGEARRALGTSFRIRPRPRPLIYLVWAVVAPRSFARWRKRELGLRRIRRQTG